MCVICVLLIALAYLLHYPYKYVYIYILLSASIIILKECFSLCAQQKKETEKQMKDNINTATKTFQRKISVEGVNE